MEPSLDILPQNSDFAIEETHYGKNVNMATSHFHSHYEIFYVTEGKRKLKINNTALYEYSSADIALLRPNIIHQGFSGTNSQQSRILINISSSLVERLCDFYTPELKTCFDEQILHLSPYEASSLRQMLNELLENKPGSLLYRETIQINLSKILLMLSKIHSKNISADTSINDVTRARVDYTVKYIQENYFLQSLVSDIAKKLYISEIHLERIFKNVMNTTMYNYISGIRIINAKKMLEAQEMSISDIAYVCGFNHHTSFTRAFRRIEGCSPKEYQKAYNLTQMSPASKMVDYIL